MTRLILGQDEKFAAWAVRHIDDVTDFGPCVAVGMVSPDYEKIWGAVVFNEFFPSLMVCSVSIAAVSPRWATRHTIRAILSIPFEQYRCRKVYAMIASDNERSLRLCEGLKFTREATLRHHYGKRRHAIILSMMEHEFRQHWWAPKKAREMELA